MNIIRNRTELSRILEEKKKRGSIIGFVPTMGALHRGHISLIENSRKNCDFTVCSIFVNPTQFNDKADLDRYPRMPEKDAEMLRNAGCDLLFLPEVIEIYPKPDTRLFDFGLLDKVLEGAHRPGHFNGVAQVVSRLFEIVKPDKAFFGLKDYQQLLIIKELCKQLNIPTQIIACSIVREPDNLAMSSRNMLLNAAERNAASLIPSLIAEAAKELQAGHPFSTVKEQVINKLKSDKVYHLDYFELCNANTLEPIDSLNKSDSSIILIACYVGKIRLIDNLVIT